MRSKHCAATVRGDSIVQIGSAPETQLRIASRRVVVPARLTEPARAELSRQLYEVHQRIFAGVSAEEFHREVVEPSAEATVIQLYLSADGRIIGYCAFHRYRRCLHGRSAIVLRAQAGLMPEYRGHKATYGFGMMRALLERIRHPFTPIYFLGVLVHSSSYHLFYKYFPQVYPHPDLETPAIMRDVVHELIDSFPAPAVSDADPFVRDDGWVTIETPKQKALNRDSDRPDVQFFKARNPGYPLGHGLVIIVPITLGNIAAALLSRLHELVLIACHRRRDNL